MSASRSISLSVVLSVLLPRKSALAIVAIGLAVGTLIYSPPSLAVDDIPIVTKQTEQVFIINAALNNASERQLPLELETTTLLPDTADPTIQEQIDIVFSNGEKCMFELTPESPTSQCVVTLPVTNTGYSITGEYAQMRDIPTAWQQSGGLETFTSKHAIVHVLHNLTPHLQAWQTAATPMEMIAAWNDLMQHLRQQFPDDFVMNYPLITAGSKQDPRAFNNEMYPADYAALMTEFGLPELQAQQYTSMKFVPITEQQNVWSSLKAHTNVNLQTQNFTNEQIHAFIRSPLFFTKNNGDTAVYFANHNPACQGKTKTLQFNELYIGDFQVVSENDICINFADFFRHELNEIFANVPPTAGNIAYLATPTAQTLSVRYDLLDGNELSYYLMLDAE